MASQVDNQADNQVKAARKAVVKAARNPAVRAPQRAAVRAPQKVAVKAVPQAIQTQAVKVFHIPFL